MHIVIDEQNPLYAPIMELQSRILKTRSQVEAVRQKYGWKRVYSSSEYLAGSIDYVSFGDFIGGPPPGKTEGYSPSPKRLGLYAWSPKKGHPSIEDIRGIEKIPRSEFTNIIDYPLWCDGLAMVSSPGMRFDEAGNRIVFTIRDNDKWRPAGDWQELPNTEYIKIFEDL